MYKLKIKSPFKKKPYFTIFNLLLAFTAIGIGALSFILSAAWAQSIMPKLILHAPILATILLVYGFLLLLFTFFFSSKLQQQSVKNTIRISNIVLCGVAALVYLLSQWWLAAALFIILAAALLLMQYTEKKIAQALWVQFTDQAILLPAGSRKKNLLWHEVNSVILQQGNITINTRANYLYQWTLAQGSKELEAIEAYCSAKIYTAQKDVVEDDW